MINATTPWRLHKDQPMAICTTPGEIDAQERFLYYWLAQHVYRDAGEIVEIGALMGASSSCFAQGVLDNPLVTDKRHRLHGFDKFEAYPHLAEKFFPHFGITDIKTGDDFSSIYRRYTSPFAEQIVLTKTDIADMTWNGAPIEILFVDCAQSADLSEKIMQVFYPYLIPGVSVVVDQDFFFERAWWFAAKAASLSDALVPLYAEDCSLVSACRAAIPRSRLDFNFDNVPFTARIDALKRTEHALGGDEALMVAVQRAYCLAESKDFGGACKMLTEIWHATASVVVRYRVRTVIERFKLPRWLMS